MMVFFYGRFLKRRGVCRGGRKVGLRNDEDVVAIIKGTAERKSVIK